MKRTRPQRHSAICPNPGHGAGVELRPDLVIAATGTAGLFRMARHRSDPAERAGVLTLTILTQPFLKTLHNVRQNLRIGPGCVAVPHPVAIIRDEKVRAKVDEAFPAILTHSAREGGGQHENLPAETRLPAEAEASSAAPGNRFRRPSVTGTARACIAGSHRCPSKAAIPPPSQRRPIPKRCLASLPEKRPHGTGQREISLPTCTVDGLFIPTPYVTDAVPHTKTAPAIAQSVRFRHCMAAGIPQGFSIPGTLFHPAGGKEGARAIPDTEATGWPSKAARPRSPRQKG
ncbi:MAG: hypothetical protein ACLSHC_09780 [Bilophila wadsworthia]